jgi:hypothetical protein
MADALCHDPDEVTETPPPLSPPPATAIATTAGSASTAGTAKLQRPALRTSTSRVRPTLKPADRSAEISAKLFALSDDAGRLAALLRGEQRRALDLAGE